MKKRLIYLFAALLLTAACYQDKSTVATFEYPDIVITASTSDTLFYAYGDTLHLSAEAVQEGVSEELLSYLWEIDMRPNSSTDRLEIGEGKELEYRILNSASNSAYYVTLTVTNLESGFFRTKIWPLYVSNSLGEGVLVANTKDGGVTYELDLISSSAVTYGYTSSTPKVTTSLYSLGNGESLQKRVNALNPRNATNFNVTPVSSYNYNLLMVGTDDELMALTPEDYSKIESNSSLLTSTQIDEFKVEALFNGGSYSTFAIIGGNMYTCGDILDYCYAALPGPDALDGGYTTSNTCAGLVGSSAKLFRYCEETHAFYYVPCWSAFQASMTQITGDSSPSSDFLADKTCVSCGVINGDRACYVMKDASDKYYCVVVGESVTAATYELDAPDIDKAETFAFCDNGDLFYYSVGNKVYASVIVSGSVSTNALNWTPDSAEEKVTMIKQYAQAWYGLHNYDLSGSGDLSYQFALSTHRTQMMVVTYNETTGEGKIYFRPFIVSTGMFSTFKDNGTVGGFGEISAICTTLR